MVVAGVGLIEGLLSRHPPVLAVQVPLGRWGHLDLPVHQVVALQVVEVHSSPSQVAGPQGVVEGLGQVVGIPSQEVRDDLAGDPASDSSVVVVRAVGHHAVDPLDLLAHEVHLDLHEDHQGLHEVLQDLREDLHEDPQAHHVDHHGVHPVHHEAHHVDLHEVHYGDHHDFQVVLVDPEDPVVPVGLQEDQVVLVSSNWAAVAVAGHSEWLVVEGAGPVASWVAALPESCWVPLAVETAAVVAVASAAAAAVATASQVEADSN